MWQRIQTVFLGITIIALVISLILPVWQGQTDGTRRHTGRQHAGAIQQLHQRRARQVGASGEGFRRQS